MPRIEMTETDHGHRELERLIFFSDAVFAIVMTLLILDIRVPDVPSDVATTEVPSLVWALWPKVRSYDRVLLWLNLVFLLSISFIPFPTDPLWEYGELRFSVIVYAASLGMARLLLAVVWWYIVAGPIRTGDELDPGMARYHFFRSLAIPALFFLSIGISLVSVNAAVASWLLLFVADVVMWRLQPRRVRF